MASIKTTSIHGQALATLAIWLGLLGLLVLLGGCNGKAAPSSAALEPKAVRMMPVALESTTQATRYAAVIRPRIEADIGFRIGGKVIERTIEVGDRVAVGTVLARLDTADLELQVNAMRAQLASAKADEVNAKADFARYGELRQGQWTTQQELDKRHTTLDRDAAKVRELEAQLLVTGNSARYATLLADAPGVVTQVLVEPGQVVAQGQAVFKIAHDGDVEAVVSVPEQRVAGLAKADMSVELWSLPGRQIKGRLREVSPMADAATRTYQARITLIDPPPEVKFGMTATLTAAVPGPGSFALLPMTALTQQGTASAVWVAHPDSGSLELRRVLVAGYQGDQLVVADGLKQGEMVVTAGVHKLTETDKVRPWTEPSR
jgi:RND family efflux transporter MFP subunit